MGEEELKELKAKMKEESDFSKTEEKTEATSSPEPEVLVQKEETAEEKYEKLNNQYLRLAAEYDNYRKRTKKEIEEFHKYATAGLMEKLLPILDTVNRGIEFNQKAEDIDSVKDGFLKVGKLFSEVLEKEGLLPIDEEGGLVDFNYHMAVFQEERSDLEDGTVLQVFEKGYKLKDKVLRAAKVKVSKCSEETPEKEETEE